MEIQNPKDPKGLKFKKLVSWKHVLTFHVNELRYDCDNCLVLAREFNLKKKFKFRNGSLNL